MSLIEWRASFALGIPAVDHEHRELVAMINDIYASLYRPDAAETVPEFLGELHAQISAHFALEERVMRDQGYPRYREHKADHERLLDEIRELMDGYEDGRHPDIEQFSRLLEGWFTEHFATHDAALHGALR